MTSKDDVHINKLKELGGVGGNTRSSLFVTWWEELENAPFFRKEDGFNYSVQT